MSAIVPVICSNEECLAFFFVSGFVGSVASLKDCTAEKCPECGSNCAIPSGNYTWTSFGKDFKPRSQADLHFLTAARELAHKATGGGVPSETFSAEAMRRAPDFTKVLDLAPTSKPEARAFWEMVFMAIGLLRVAYETTPPAASMEIFLPKEIMNVIQGARPSAND